MPRDLIGLARRGGTTLAGVAAVSAILCVCFHIPNIRNTTVTFLLLLAILWIATNWGRFESITASLVAALGFAIWFHTPIGLLRITDQEGWVAVAGFLITTVVVSQVSLQARLRAADALRRKQESESLLLNILPPDVADELRSNGMVAPKYFEDVTIMFTDFVGFTASAERLPAGELVRLLNEYFTAFDHICARYKLEKLKTVGDSYMCIAGLPFPNPGHAVDAILAALEMVQEVVSRDRPESPVRWKMRVGIHTGPVIAGVVGINKFAFDIWGDTVNFSSRMESSGQPNRVNISEQTYARVRDFFECEYRGKVSTKEKREYDMYFATGIAPRLVLGADRVPASAFAEQYQLYFRKDPPSFPAFLLNAPELVAARYE
jgi:class 3 adenylate cyclase